jgi:hypothetical protein
MKFCATVVVLAIVIIIADKIISFDYDILSKKKLFKIDPRKDSNHFTFLSGLYNCDN